MIHDDYDVWFVMIHGDLWWFMMIYDDVCLIYVATLNNPRVTFDEPTPSVFKFWVTNMVKIQRHPRREPGCSARGSPIAGCFYKGKS